MSNRNILQALQSAGGAGGATLDVDDVFSTFLYDGTNVAQTITNNIDLTEGGLVWQKMRFSDNDPSDTQDHYLRDTARGGGYRLNSNTTNVQFNDGGITAFNSNGFSLSSGSAGNINQGNYVSWTFRKAPKFFDVVTYTGTGSDQLINHNLGCVPGFVMVKRISSGGSSTEWSGYHRSLQNTKYIMLNATQAAAGNNPRTVSDTQYMVHGNYPGENQSGGQYVAYLWAHNNNDGEFGPDGDQDIIKCGSYTGNGTVGNAVTLGFEPQWIMIKNADRNEAWYMYDVMRGILAGGNDRIIYANASDVELDTGDSVDLTPTGFSIKRGQQFFINYTGDNYIYMAIRRGPIAVPEDATKVFSVNLNTGGGNVFTTGFAGDMNLATQTTGTNNFIISRLTDRQYLMTDSTSAQNNLSSSEHWNKSNTTIDLATGYFGSGAGTVSYTWRKAPGYFDVVCYAGSTTTPRTISHNLTVIPEMIWLKGRDAGGGQWYVYHKDTGNQAYGALNNNYYIYTASDGVVAQTIWNATNPTASVFSLGNASNGNSNGQNFIAYLFATAPGVSKVGSFTGSGSDVTVDCGFSSGAKFVMVKDASANGDWYVWDSVRGIVAGNDGYLELNTTDAENTGGDYIDPHSSGFIITSGFMQSGRTYIFYAIA
tara:strand:+ start:471 stop:2426 length:1956 start_codon:yes stop_codon:yes gene_type:complete